MEVNFQFWVNSPLKYTLFDVCSTAWAVNNYFYRRKDRSNNWPYAVKNIRQPLPILTIVAPPELAQDLTSHCLRHLLEQQGLNDIKKWRSPFKNFPSLQFKALRVTLNKERYFMTGVVFETPRRVGPQTFSHLCFFISPHWGKEKQTFGVPLLLVSCRGQPQRMPCWAPVSMSGHLLWGVV